MTNLRPCRVKYLNTFLEKRKMKETTHRTHPVDRPGGPRALAIQAQVSWSHHGRSPYLWQIENYTYCSISISSSLFVLLLDCCVIRIPRVITAYSSVTYIRTNRLELSLLVVKFLLYLFLYNTTTVVCGMISFAVYILHMAVCTLSH